MKEITTLRVPESGLIIRIENPQEDLPKGFVVRSIKKGDEVIAILVPQN